MLRLQQPVDTTGCVCRERIEACVTAGDSPSQPGRQAVSGTELPGSLLREPLLHSHALALWDDELHSSSPEEPGSPAGSSTADRHAFACHDTPSCRRKADQ